MTEKNIVKTMQLNYTFMNVAYNMELYIFGDKKVKHSVNMCSIPKYQIKCVGIFPEFCTFKVNGSGGFVCKFIFNKSLKINSLLYPP